MFIVAEGNLQPLAFSDSPARAFEPNTYLIIIKI